MLRKTIAEKIEKDGHFRHRGTEPGRLENFSDAVFALAITLLLISTSPPTTILQIKKFAFDLIPFVMCITLIVLIWHEHFVFYYRYGLRNGRVIFLNAIFLIIVLFYVYPLKFLTKLSLFAIAAPLKITWLLEDLRIMMKGGSMAELMIIYGVGASCVFFVLVFMYRYALKNKAELELNEIEEFDTRVSIRTNTLLGSIPLLSVVLAIIFYNQVLAGLYAGFSYFLYGPIMALHGRRVDKSRSELLMKKKADEPEGKLQKNEL